VTEGDAPVVSEKTKAPGTPLVSIVVCFYNGVEMTTRCIDSIEKNTPGIHYEVVLVDDGSEEAGAGELARLPGVRLIRSEHNQGFTRSANLGARHAVGHYLVFLNNDTAVEPGWLDALLDAARSGPDVGAVGAMLISPDGLLQEAGGIIWSDATGDNYGRMNNCLDSKFRYRREVDYCSGACLLLRRQLFERVGGFDEDFAPGFYEDTDLCFTLRSKGYVVLYEPDARVVHVGGATFGTAQAAGLATRFVKSGQELNRLVFQAKWAEELLRHYPPRTAVGMRGGRAPDRPRVLVCDSVHPPDKSSGGLRLAWMLRLLHEMGCEVTYFPWDRAEDQPYSDWLRRVGVEVQATGKDIGTMTEGRDGLYDLVILCRPKVAAELRDAVRFHFPQAVLVYDSIDLHFLRLEREAALSPPAREPKGLENDLRRERRRELDEMRAADVVSAVTEYEAEVIRSLVPDREVVVLPNVHAVRSEAVPGPDGRSGLLFIGAYRHVPNVDAVRWFTSEILPLVREHEPARLVALGASPSPEIEALASDTITVPGYVKDVFGYFDQARVFVTPLRWGAGMKGKVGMAMAMGLPVVTTSIGAEGMGLVDGTNALVADDAASFAAAVVRLYRDDDLWSSISEEARRFAGQEWSPEAMKERLMLLLNRTRASASMTPRTWGLLNPEGDLERANH
jgi:O-antigen biosynthesis protein